ncbi:hypothetical protein BLA29_007755 [Euroglyphus maynei]|uniref:Uncharacterized protein n=1 Tax=Euroglyphus maynei TaxID=6958 RepID=A0A1Y3AXB4_EURMA|nr:hypothetical protein BLA29_007755 [Euroglyphus maynei]
MHQHDSYDILNRIFIQFIQLLNDNEEIIRNDSVLQIENLVNVLAVPIESDENRCSQKTLIRLFVHIMTNINIQHPDRYKQSIRAIIKIALHFLTDDDTEAEPCTKLFDKTKMNTFIDEYSIWMDLIDEIHLLCRDQIDDENMARPITLLMFIKQIDDYICERFDEIECESKKEMDSNEAEFIHSNRSRMERFLKLFQKQLL